MTGLIYIVQLYGPSPNSWHYNNGSNGSNLAQIYFGYNIHSHHSISLNVMFYSHNNIQKAHPIFHKCKTEERLQNVNIFDRVTE